MTAPKPEPGPFLRGRDVIVLVLCGFGVAVLYAAFLLPDPPEEIARYPGHRYYALQAEAWLRGRLDIGLPVPTELLALPDPYNPDANEKLRMAGGAKGFHDLSLYQGKFYMYWGPAPALVAFLPWRLLTGHNLSSALAAYGFAWVAWLASSLMVTRLARRKWPETSPLLLFTALLGIAVCSWSTVTFTRASVWEVPIYAACCFGAIAWWLLLECMFASARAKRFLLAGASLAWALAVASRPNWIVGTPALLWPLWEYRKTWRTAEFRSLFLAASVPITLGVVGLLWHNYARFGSIAEFGQRWQLAGVRMVESKTFSAGNVLFNVYHYLFAPAPMVDYFPFILTPRLGPLPKGYLGIENTFGLLAIQPWLWLALVLSVTRAALRLVVPVIISFVALLGILSLFSGSALRYELEVAAPLCVLAAVGVVSLRPAVRWRANTWFVAVGVLLMISAIGAFLVETRILIGERKIQAPYPTVGRFANRLATTHGYSPPGGTYGVEMDVIFPPHEPTVARGAEALVTCGGFPAINSVLVDYPNPDHIRFHYVHNTIIVSTPPLPFVRGNQHHIRIELGAMLPPANHPFWGDTPVDQIEKRRAHILVLCNGQPVITGVTQTYPSAQSEPYFGRVETPTGGQHVFTGRITNRVVLRVVAP